MYYLHVKGAAPSERRVPLRPGSVRIGSDERNDLRLDGYGVSGSHAEVRLDGAGVRIRDLGSANGTWVNGSRVTDALLEPGDRILLGTVMVYRTFDRVSYALVMQATRAIHVNDIVQEP